MRVRAFLAAAAAVMSCATVAGADVLPYPDDPAIPVGSCWVTSAYFENSTVTRFCFVSETTATYEGRVLDAPNLLCRGKASLSFDGDRLSIHERDAPCSDQADTWTAEVMSCVWSPDVVGGGGPVPCTVDEPNFGRAKLTLTRE